jgi:hypothetical protein
MALRESRLQGTFNVNDPSCWIKPDGTIFYVNHSSHVELAQDLGDSTGGRELEGKGWLHISGASIYAGYDEWRDSYIPPTQAQIDALFDIGQLCQQAGDEYFTIRYNRFIEKYAPKETL